MKTTRSVLGALLLAVAIPAQAGVAPKPAALAEYDKLVAEWTAAQKTYTDAMKEVTASEAYKKARADKDAAKLKELTGSLARPDGKAFGARALALADQYTGDACVKVLAYAASAFNDADTTKAAVARVQKDFLKSPALVDLLENGPVLSRFLGAAEADAFLNTVIEQSPHAAPKAWAMYWQATTLQRKKDATDEEKAAAEKLLAAGEALAAGTELGDRIAAPRFEKEKLQVGMEVPDIVGEDVDGVAFKLSDYRGKVVLIDFWGFW